MHTYCICYHISVCPPSWLDGKPVYSVLVLDPEAGVGENSGAEGITTYASVSICALLLSCSSIVLLFMEGQKTESASVSSRGHTMRSRMSLVVLSLTQANCLTEHTLFCQCKVVYLEIFTWETNGIKENHGFAALTAFNPASKVLVSSEGKYIWITNWEINCD